MAESQAPQISLDVTDIEPSTDAFAEPVVDKPAADASSNAGNQDDKSAEDKAAEEQAAADAKAKEDADAEAAKKAAEDGGEEEETPEQKAEREAAEAAAAEADDKPKKGAEARKEELNREIRDLVSKRNQLRDEVAAKNAKVYAPQTAEELVEAGVDPAEARVQALEQRDQMREFNNHVADVNANLNIEAAQVMSDFPVFDPQSPTYDKALADRAAALYESVAGMETDEKTQLIIDLKVLPYNIYKAFAETHSSGASTGQVAGQAAVEKMLANAAPESSTPKPKVEKKADDFLVGLTKGLNIKVK